MIESDRLPAAAMHMAVFARAFEQELTPWLISMLDTRYKVEVVHDFKVLRLVPFLFNCIVLGLVLSVLPQEGLVVTHVSFKSAMTFFNVRLLPGSK